jgi:hypothetical protein
MFDSRARRCILYVDVVSCGRVRTSLHIDLLARDSVLHAHSVNATKTKRMMAEPLPQLLENCRVVQAVLCGGHERVVDFAVVETFPSEKC